MMDERERLGQVVQGFAPPGDAFEHLVTRRGRKQRNRRIRAGALGVIVALAMGLVFVKSVTSNGMPADQPEPRPARTVVSGALAYGLGGDIYVADPDGTNPVRITDVAALDDECPGELGYGLPSWSPDGRYLAFRGPQGPGCSSPTGVVITDPQGNVVATFPGQDQINVMAPAWSPDSARVAVWDEYGRTIGVYRIDGTRETQIAMSRRGDIGRLAWMPDGASLSVDQYEVPLDGGTPRELPFPFTEFNSWPQRYSPDGSLVAYANRHGLMVARPDGSETRAVFGPVGPYTWTWSPTGRQIALTADAPGDPWAPNELHVVDVATGSVTQVFEGERRTSLWVIGFSPEGDRVLFTNYPYGADSPSSLWSVGVDGSDAHQVVAGSDDGTWRPI
jgi:Tol biopolymer transport system component